MGWAGKPRSQPIQTRKIAFCGAQARAPPLPPLGREPTSFDCARADLVGGRPPGHVRCLVRTLQGAAIFLKAVQLATVSEHCHEKSGMLSGLVINSGNEAERKHVYHSGIGVSSSSVLLLPGPPIYLFPGFLEVMKQTQKIGPKPIKDVLPPAGPRPGVLGYKYIWENGVLVL